MNLTQSILFLMALCLWAQAQEPRDMPGAVADSGRKGFVFPAAKTVVVSLPVLLSGENSSVSSFVIEDGPDPVDVIFQSGLRESGGMCGCSKSGAGTLRIEGDISLQGVITVYEGTLDLSKASVPGGLRINLYGNAKASLPESDKENIRLYRNGEKQNAISSRREQWQTLKYGIFSHYVWNGYGMTALQANEDGTVAKTIDELANAFDVENYVNQLIEAKAQYVVFTAWHSGACPLFPSQAMKKWAPGRVSCPQRDLLGDLLDECRKHGLPALFYCHPYQPVAEPHNDWINDLYAELVDRYGDRLHGLWIDENFQDCTQDKVVDYPRLLRTIKERNPDLILIHNNGGTQTYGVDEGVQEVQWEFHEGRAASVYQIFSQTAKSPEDMLITTVIQAAANTMGGGIQWSIDAIGAGGGKMGGLDPKARPILDGFVRLLAPIAESVTGTRTSTSYLPPYRGAVVRYADLTWGVATSSADGRKEYLHVLKAPQGRSLRLPPAADGKVFARARLLEGGKAITLEQSHRGITLTLPDGVEWKKPDTVIVMDAITPGGVGLVNNTSRAMRYEDSSWRYERMLPENEYRGDRHRATADGDAFHFTFTGTDVEWIGSRGPSRGKIEILLDGKPHTTIDHSGEPAHFTTVFTLTGLARGPHTLTAIKRGGAEMTVDAFRVSDLINDSDPQMIFSDTTRHDARYASLEGPWEPRGASWINGHTFTLSFHGTGVEVLGGAAHGSGDLVLTLDGKEHSTVHCHGAQTTRSLTKIGGLTNSPHVIMGRFTNPHPAGFISALDGFVVTRPDYWQAEKHRGLFECGDDVHVSTIKHATGHLTFSGSGVEVIATRDSASRSAHYTLESNGFSLWMGLNQYAPATISQSPVFRLRNLVPGKHTIHFHHAANQSGVNFSHARLSIDAIRVYKGESSSASPLFWGADAKGGDGTWANGSEKNWHDGAMAIDWQDYGAEDHGAVFTGKAGKVRVPSPVRVNRIEFHSDGYALHGAALILTGENPLIHLAAETRVTCALRIQLPDGTTLPPGRYDAISHPAFIGGKGTLVIAPPQE